MQLPPKNEAAHSVLFHIKYIFPHPLEEAGWTPKMSRLSSVRVLVLSKQASLYRTNSH